MSWEDDIYIAQDEWIKVHFADNPMINQGWTVDEVTKEISTKIYGYGVLTTNEHLVHVYEPFEG